MWISKNDGRYELEDKLKHSDGTICQIVQLLRVGKTTLLNLEPIEEEIKPQKVNGMLQFSTNDFDYNKKDNIFVQESSMLCLSPRDWNGGRRRPVEPLVELSNPKTRDSRQFKFIFADMHDGEAMGWNYESKDGIKLLIIND